MSVDRVEYDRLLHECQAATANEARLRDALERLTRDPLLAWGASVYEDHWRCNWCQAYGGEIDDEPHGVHSGGCPWTLAFLALGAI